MKMKASLPRIFLIMLTILLASPAIGLFGQRSGSAKVAIDPLVKGWRNSPARSDNDPGLNLPIEKGYGLRFYTENTKKWRVMNNLDRSVTFGVHFKNDDGKTESIYSTLNYKYYTELDVDHSKQLTVDVVELEPSGNV
ncbi:hypothetical protein PGT21_029515 [Puccinia graminis f. sp. tritici]|uniref:Uncharacterized protein n=2 Tax=Puccinia graminis f. sp. tritici TaxID=56615 RepID=A0A5B0NH91_PUCGR|nr:hypothetical protein PGT21_029515 [Puccinia graminis f. sp. tritici]